MSDELARAVLSVEAQFDEAQIQAAATRAAHKIENTLNKNISIGGKGTSQDARTVENSFKKMGDSAVASSSKINSSFRDASIAVSLLPRALAPATSAFTSFGSSAARVVPALSRLAAAAGPVGVAVAGITAAAIGAAVAIPKLAGAVVSAAQPARVLAGSQDALNVVLGRSSARFEELIASQDRLGVSRQQLNKALIPTIALLRQTGLGTEKLARTTNDLFLSARDLSSRLGQDVNVVLDAFGAGIRGETESLERFGISFNALSVEQELVRRGVEKVNGEFREQDKQLARISIILDQASLSSGGFADSQTMLGGITRNVDSAIADLRAEISKSFLPAAKEINSAILEMVEDVGPQLIQLFEDLEPLINLTADAFGVFAEGVGIGTTLLGDSVARWAQIFRDPFRPFVTGNNVLNQMNQNWVETSHTINDVVSAGSKVGLIGPLLSQRFGQVSLSLEEMNKLFSDNIAVEEKLKALSDGVARAQKDLAQSFEAVTRANENVIGANERLVEARIRLDDVTQQLVNLESERSLLLNDTARDVREVVEAEEDLLRIGNRLTDLDREQADILKEIAELRTPATARELADVDRDIERAKIALNRAIREEQELLNRVNEEQQESVDLTGLSLDQLHTRLAIARATAAAQRAQKRETGSAVNAEEEQILARIGVGDAQEKLNTLLEARTTLDAKVINNGGKIALLEERLNRLSVDRTGLLRSQGDAQSDLNSLRAGETTRATEIKRIDDQILSTKQQQTVAANGIATAVRGVEQAEREVLTAVEEVRTAEGEVRQAKKDQNYEASLLLGTERQINDALRDRLSLEQNPALLQRLARGSLAALLPQLTDPIQRANVSFRQTFGSPAFLDALGTALLNNPRSPLQDLLRMLGVEGFAEGGLINRPTFAAIGEHFRPEVVLPLTKPDRVWSLLSRTLPRYPGALRAAQTAIAPSGLSHAARPGSGPPGPAGGPTAALAGLVRNSSSGAGQQAQAARTAARRERTEFANELAEALAAKLNTMNATVEYHFETPTDEDAQIRRIRRVVEKTLKNAGWRL